MFDIGVTKLALIGAVALIVIGPERLPRVARMVGTLLGRAQRYVADVKAEVNRSIELEELQKMKSQFEGAARDVHDAVRKEIARRARPSRARAEASAWRRRLRRRRDARTSRPHAAAAPTSRRARTGASSAAPCPPGTSNATACARTPSRAPRAWRASARAGQRSAI